MCGYQDALSNVIPVDWLDPYGRTPFAKDAELSVDITIVETDDGIRAKSVKNPPTSGSSRLMNALKNALGVGFDICEPPCSSQQAADQGKQNDMIDKDKKENSDKMESADHRSSDTAHKDRNLGEGGSEDSGIPREPDDTKKKPWD